MTSPPRVPPPAPRPHRGAASIAVVVVLIALVLTGVAPVGATEPTTRPIETRTATAVPTGSPTPTTTPVPAAPTPTPVPSATPGADTAAAAEATTRPMGQRLPAPTATPPWTGPTTLGSTIRFFGRGYGHGVGMSQYGARGRALDGHDATEILAHYYQGAVLGSIDLATTIRVRVLVNYQASAGSPLVFYGRGGTWTIDGVTTTFPADAKVTVTPSLSGSIATWRLRVTSAGGSVLRDATTTHFRMRPAASTTRFQVWSRPSSYDTYRGVVRAILDDDSPTANVANELPLEWYLRGVIPAEMPSSWPAEALEAQSIAARSFAARRLRPGESYYDVRDDTSSQVYRGSEAEKSATNAAIVATEGLVLRSSGSIANTMFHSAGGGATEHNENVYVSSTGAKVAGPVSYLRGSRDRRRDGSAYDSASPYATWSTTTYTRAQLSAIFAADSRTDVGSLTVLDLRARGVSGRLIKVVLTGSKGSKTVSGDVFRSAFNAGRPAADPMLRSTLFDTKPVP
jgi:stage II sporulation protein D